MYFMVSSVGGLELETRDLLFKPYKPYSTGHRGYSTFQFGTLR